MSKVLMITGDFVEDYENMVPFQALIAMGHEVHAVCPDKQAGRPLRHQYMTSKVTKPILKNVGTTLVLTHLFQLLTWQITMPFMCQGRAPEYLRLNAQVLEMVQHFADNDKPIASICHGAQLLATAGIIKGKKCQPTLLANPK